jgi:hypothetical protein
MARLHIKFREDDIDPRIIELTTRLCELKPWAGPDDLKMVRYEIWLHGACMVYGIPEVTLVMQDQHTRRDIPTYGEYKKSEGGMQAVIILRKYSLISLFHQFRHHMQASVDEAWEHMNSDKNDAQAWACSLFYIVKPNRFRAMVRKGRVAGVKPEDLLKTRSK